MRPALEGPGAGAVSCQSSLRHRDAPAHGQGSQGEWQGPSRKLTTLPQRELRREGLPWKNKELRTLQVWRTGRGVRGSVGLSAHILPSCPSLQAMTPKATGGPNDAAPKEETDSLSSDEGEMRSPGEEAGSPIPSPIPAGKEVSEEEEVAGTPGWEVRKPGASTGTSQHGSY